MLQLLKYCFSPIAINTYIIVASNKDCIIIDPGAFFKEEKEQLLSEIKNKSLNPVGIWQTHAHFDHVFATKLIVDHFNIIPKIHALEKPVIERIPQAMMLYNLQFDNYTGEFYFWGDKEDSIEFGGYNFDIIHTPGHSPGSVAYYCKDMNFIISGDVIFNESIGRTDLPGADYDTLVETIKTKIYTLLDHTIIYNGHGNETTVGHEKKFNPFVSI